MSKKKINHLKYNKVEFDSILNNIQAKRYNYALEQLSSYMKKYPFDVSAYLYYANILIIIGNAEEALKILNSSIVLFSLAKEDIEQAFYFRIKALIVLERYQECYQYINDNINLFYAYPDDTDIEIMIFLRKKLHLEVDDYEEVPTYFLKQIIDYREDLFFSHMKKFSYESQTMPSGVFLDSFPLEEVYRKLRQILPNSKKINHGILVNAYLIKYNNCGIVNSKNVNYFRVITLTNSNQIMAMYPYSNESHQDYIDMSLNSYTADLLEEENRESQVDKFMKRYAKKIKNN